MQLFCNFATMKQNLPQFLIAAPASGSGKTTVAIGIMAALVRRGMAVQPFKCGPDYIDTKYHSVACGRPSYNLDLFMSSESHVRQIYAEASDSADVCVVEGMMGLFDGFLRQQGSPAHIASTLHLPVILVVDASHTGYSIAPLLYGMAHYDEAVRVVGVIFNKVGSDRHAQMLREACSDVGLVCLGCVPRQRQVEASSRYLGLDFTKQTDTSRLADMMEEHLDLDLLISITAGEKPHIQSVSSPDVNTVEGRILVAHNADSFSLIYQRHIDLLEKMGKVEYFDPTEDSELPADTALLYLPGGYPEQHLEELYRAERTRKSIHDYAMRGGRIIAECGGMMYLCKEIAGDGEAFPMCGVLPYVISNRKADRKLSLGYRRVVMNGREYRGHEFHYTHFQTPQPPTSATVYDARGQQMDSPFIIQGNVIASYTHLYWGKSLPDLFLS